MMEEAVTCDVCSEVYQIGARDPLVLPCGHTFCRACLTAVHNSSSGHLICPTCRRDAEVHDLDKLPICYPLLSLSTDHGEIKFGSCLDHDEEQRYWCHECHLPLCSICLYKDHQQGHQVLLTKVVMKDKKQQLKEQLLRVSDEAVQKRREIHSLYVCLTTKMKQVLTLEENIDLLLADVQDVSHVEDILACEEKIKKMTKIQNEPSLHKKLNCTQKKMTEMNSTASLDYEDVEESPFVETLLLEVPYDDTPRMRLDYREGRLLLHSTAHPADGHIAFETPSEVFLELGVDGKCLGRVYIRLWCHLRRAQQFLALCMGTLGHSYVGSCFSHVAYQNEPKETLCCKEYVTEGGAVGMRDLLTDLEWGGEYKLEARMGLLIPLSKFVDEHGFGICTRDKHDGTFHCPFGEVVDGMEVVQAAVQHQPVTEVTITYCGLVLPSLST